jgi:citrate lyase subunit beta / citryl-CoA lyase
MQARPLRALLFVPGVRPDLFEKAARSGADAIVLDLEDAVAPASKERARSAVADAITPLAAATGQEIFVRVNDLSTAWCKEDLSAVARPGLTGITLPKVERAQDILHVAGELDGLEAAAGLPGGSIDIQPLLETALGIHDAYEILTSSTRIRSCWGGFAKDGDLSCELDAVWTRGGEESLYVRSKVLLEARAARVPYPISGTWTDLADLDGLARFADQNRSLGYTGMYVIHPSHVEAVSAAFTPTSAEIEWHRRVLAELDGEGADVAAIRLDGVMVDRAMVARARAVLAAFDSLPRA